MKSLNKIFLAGLSAALLAFTSCETTGDLSEHLSSAGEIAEIMGLGTAGKILTATASTSKALEDITPENEYYIGRAVAATILSNYSTYEDPVKEAYVNKICLSIALNSSGSTPYNGYHVKLLDSQEKNAFATSGGHIFVTKGLVDCAESEDSLAAILAHEIAHVELKHSLKAIKASRWTQAGFDITSAALSGVHDELKNISNYDTDNIIDAESVVALAESMGDMVEDVVSNMVNNGYSKNQELDADNRAIILLKDAGYNPYAMLDVLNKLNEEKTDNSLGMYKTHPSPKERIKNAKSSLKKLKKVSDTTSYRTQRFNSVWK